jgi:hypothetical protein
MRDTHGHRFGAKGRLSDRHGSLAGKTEKDLRIVDFNRHVVLAEPGDDLVAGRADVVGVFAPEGREALDQAPGLGQGDVGEGVRDFR